MKNDYYLLSDVVRLLKVPPYKITYVLNTRKIAEPARIGGRRCFTETDIDTIATALGIQRVPETDRGDQGGRDD